MASKSRARPKPSSRRGADGSSRSEGDLSRPRDYDVARWVSMLLLAATVLAFVILIAAAPSRSGKPGNTGALAGFLAPGALYLVALMGIRRRDQRRLALMVLTIAAASFGTGLDSIFPGVGWRLLTVPLALGLLLGAGWIASPRGADTAQRWWACAGALMFGGIVLGFALGAV